MYGSNIRAERARLGLTKDKAAQSMGISKNALARWESGKVTPTVENLYALAKFYRCTPDYLLGMTDERHKSVVGT